MSQPIHQYLIREDGCHPLRSAGLPSGARLKVYEVLRIVEGVPLFQEAHLSRLRRSAGLAGRRLTATDQILGRALRELIFCNGVKTGNVRLEIAWYSEDPTEAGTFTTYFVPHTYPTGEQYRRGVPIGLLRAERSTPNVKIEQRRLRERANALIREENLYEVLLVDQQEHITEGSRSNFFLIREQEVLTPPVAAVLPGITRSEVIHLCRLLAIPVRETELPLAWLAEADAAFLTGTSPGVLPIASIGAQPCRADHPLLHALHVAYEERVRNYLLMRRSATRPVTCG